MDKVRAWPFTKMADMTEILRQVWDLQNFNRPVSSNVDIQRVTRALDHDGVAILENVVSKDVVVDARKDLDRLTEIMPDLAGEKRVKPRSTGGTKEYTVHEYQRDLCVYRSHDPLAFSPEYAKFLMLPEVLEVLRCYFGPSWFYQAMIGTRTESVDWVGKGFDKWHHDARGRKLNIFLLLSDVPKSGAATEVMAGSHRLLYDRFRRKKNFFSDNDLEKLRVKYGWKPIICSAPAGSLVFFNAHALHRGRRSPLARDAFQVNCMTKRSHLWPQTIDGQIFASLTANERTTLMAHANLSVT